tara:strand:+ start:677 stop:802 length:126 start_codon:yes stop_codon:yes gene_type:complete
MVISQVQDDLVGLYDLGSENLLFLELDQEILFLTLIPLNHY